MDRIKSMMSHGITGLERVKTKNGAMQVSVRCFLTYTVKMLGTTLGWYTDYPEGRISVNFRTPFRKMKGHNTILFVFLLLPP
jgi:hypothetical protein